MKKRILALALAALMLLALTACGPKEANTPDPTPTPEQMEGTVYKIGICQLAPHPALDAATEGFIDALNALLPGQVDIDNQNAAGDTPTCATIINGFVSSLSLIHI